MESTNTLNCDIRAKEEPGDVSLEENYGEMIDEKPDHKNFLLLPFSPENSTHKLPKCDANRKSELDDGVEIVVECEDVKPDMNLLTVEKIDDDFQYHLRGEKDSNGYEIQNIIKIESAEKVNKEFDGDAAEESNLNFECEPVENNKKRGIFKKLTTNAFEINRKNFSTKGNLDRHVKTLGKTFAQKSHLKKPIDKAHIGVPYMCDICQKTFIRKRSLLSHIDSVHNGVRHACDICGKNFRIKRSIKILIDSVHNSIKHTCDVCGKSFTQKGYLKIHIDSVHNGITHTCDVCGKTLSSKFNLQIHISRMHSGVTHACNICGKNFRLKRSLKAHIDSVGHSHIST